MQYLNKQKYSECQLVTAINAAICLGEPPVKQDSLEYERLVDFVAARHGSAIDIEKAYEYLKITSEMVPSTLEEIKKSIDEGRPIEITIFHDKTGAHSVLVVDYRKDRLKVLNFHYVTTRHMWVDWEILDQYICRLENITPNRGLFRSFDRRREGYVYGTRIGRLGLFILSVTHFIEERITKGWK